MHSRVYRFLVKNETQTPVKPFKNTLERIITVETYLRQMQRSTQTTAILSKQRS